MNTSTKGANRLETRPSKTNFTLLSQAEQTDQLVLEDVCSAYGINLDYPSSKIAYAKALVDYILKNTERILSQLTIWDLETIRDLVSIGAGNGLFIQFESCSTILDELLLIKIIRSEENEGSVFVMADELRLAIGTKANEILKDKTYLKRADINRFIQGLKTLYGVVSVEMVRYALRDKYPETEENKKLIREMVVCPENMANTTKGSLQPDQLSFYSPIVLEAFKDLVDLQSITTDLMGMKEFTYQEIMAVGHRPYPIFQFEEARRLNAYLIDDFGVDPILADSAMYGLWLENQTSFPNFMRTMFLINKYFSMDDQLKWDRLVVFVNEFLDAAPCWALLGYSVNDKRNLDHKIRAAKHVSEHVVKERLVDEYDGVGDDYEEDGVYKLNLHVPIKHVS